MSEKIAVDILAMEVEQGLSHWLSPRERFHHVLVDIRARNREKWLIKQGRKPTPFEPEDVWKVEHGFDMTDEERAERYNQNHQPAGSPNGGQFAPADGGGGGGGSSSTSSKSSGGGKTSKSAKAPKAKKAESKSTPLKAAVGFVSPNVSNLTFEDAKSEIGGDRHQEIMRATAEVDAKLGLTSHETSAIGAWADGAENSIMVDMPGASYDEAKVAMAMKGYLANQKAVVVFEPDVNGEAYLASFEMKVGLDKAHENLLKAGIEFHTLEEMEGGTRVHVLGFDQETLDKVSKEAERHDAEVEVIAGRGEFVGTTKQDGTDDEQRADARRVYDEVVREAEAAEKLPGRDIGRIWKDLRDRWSPVASERVTADSETDEEPSGS